MYLPSLIVLLAVVLHNAESNVIQQQPQACNGGYCLPKHLCPTANDAPRLGQHGYVSIGVGEANECGDFMKICCKESNRNTRNNAYECGISNPEGLVHNVDSNSMYAKYAEFPWTVAIFQMHNFHLTHVGGGTLIHPKFVLIVGHMMKNYLRYVARFGEWSMTTEAEIYPVKDIIIEEYILHPSYRASYTSENDIGLAVLRENVIYSEHIRPICLPSTQDEFDGQRCFGSGWGMDIRTGQPASTMKRTEQSVIPRTQCQNMLWELSHELRLHPSVMCANGVKEQNTCSNDDGTPLACQRNDGSYVLAGITSWPVNCGRSDFPAVYVDVAKFTHWINDTIEGIDEMRAAEAKKRKAIMPVPYANSYPNYW